MLLKLFPAFAAMLCGCAVDQGRAPAAQSPAASILASSMPAGGSTVAGPVNSLELHFNPPARLDELTVSGPDGTMPMMVHAVGEVADYSIPVPGLGRGAYTVNWKASAASGQYEGRFAFAVK